jgi:hypothetical protein
MARFFRRGVSKTRFLPAQAGTSPTRAEITAGVDLSVDVANINGFQFSNSPIATPDLSDNFDSQITGPDTVGDSSIDFYDQDNASTIRTAVAKGTAGIVLLLPYGDVPTKRCESWYATSLGVNDAWSMDATAAQFNVQFAITKRPTQAGVIPA